MKEEKHKNGIASIVGKMAAYFGSDVRRINHALKVHSFAKCIGELEGLSGETQNILEAAAVLHDIGIKESERKYNSSAGKYQEIEGPPVAKELLKEEGFGETDLERILFLIGNHHSYGKIDGGDFQILVEADFLVNIYEDDMQADAVRSVANKYFRTKTGTGLLESMYLNQAPG